MTYKKRYRARQTSNAVIISATCVVSVVDDVIALLSSIQGGFCCTSVVRVIVDQVVAPVEDKPGLATRRHQQQARCDT